MSLVAVSHTELEALARRIERGELVCPLDPTRPSLARLAKRAPSLFGHTHEATLAIIATALAERAAPRPNTELVWTGPDVATGLARDTAVVVRELFSGATKHVLVAGYAFDHGEEILRPLHTAMVERGVETGLFIDVARAESRAAAADHLMRFVDGFCRRNWPFGAPLPHVYYDPRTVWGDDYASIHAKCVVVDGHRTFISSANFTGRGQARNVEVGVVVDDVELAGRPIHQWRQLVANDRFRRCL